MHSLTPVQRRRAVRGNHRSCLGPNDLKQVRETQASRGGYCMRSARHGPTLRQIHLRVNPNNARVRGGPVRIAEPNQHIRHAGQALRSVHADCLDWV